MKRSGIFLMLLAAAIFAACGDDHKTDDHDDHDGHEHEEGHDDHDDHDGHEHEEGHDDHDGHEHKDGHEGHDDHDGHEHEEGHDDHEHGEKHALGKSKAGSHDVTLAIFGEIEAGHEAVVDIEIEGEEHITVRAWVGVESGKGSLKAKLEGKDGDYHGHLEVPAKLPDRSAIWVEIEDEKGSRNRTSFKFAKHP